MSTEVAAPAPVATTSETVPATEPAEVPAAPVVEEQPAAATSAPATDDKVESPESHPASPEQHKKRSPFGDLKNKLFHHKVSDSLLYCPWYPAWNVGSSRVRRIARVTGASSALTRLASRDARSTRRCGLLRTL